MKKQRLAANIFWLYGLQGLNYLTPALLIPFLMRTLGVSQYGLVVFAQSIAQYFILVTDFGFNFSATRSISLSRGDSDSVNKIFWTVLTIKLALLVLCALTLQFILTVVRRFHDNSGVYYAAYLMAVGNAIFPLWLFQGIEQMRSISVLTGLGKLLAAVLVLLFVKSSQDTLLTALLLSSGFVFSGLLGMTVALRKHVTAFYRPTWQDIVSTISESRHLFLTTAAISLYSNTNTFLVGMLSGMEQVGYFNLADKLIRAFGGLIAPLIQATYPRMIALRSQSTIQALMFVRKMLLYAICAGVVIGLGLVFGAKQLAILLFSHQSNETVTNLLRLLALFPLLAALNYILGTLLLIPFGLDKVQSRMLLAIGAANVLLGFLLIPHLGALGGVLAMLATETVQMLGSIFMIRRYNINIFRPATSE